MEFRNQTLDNGLEVVAECNPNAYSLAVGFFVKAGSRDETDDIWGVSHFLEHMVFKGTPTRTAADVNRELDEIGSSSNASTSEEITTYYATMLPEYGERAIALLADIMRPSLRDDDFEMEKQVILEEIAKYEDEPPFNAHEKCMAAYFGDHPLGRSILGSVDSVSALTPVQMHDYFRQRYSPSNMLLAVAGNVAFEELVSLADQHCGKWEPFDAARETPPATPNYVNRLITKETAVQEYVVQIFDGPSATDEDRFAARLLGTIIGDDSGSRFFWEFIDTGLAECAVFGAQEYQGTGTFMSYLCCEPDDTAECLATVQRILTDVRENGITDEELTRAKSKVCSQIILASERTGNRMFAVGGNWVRRRTYRTVRESVQRYQSITKEQIDSIVQRFGLAQQATVVVGNLTDLDWPA